MNIEIKDSELVKNINLVDIVTLLKTFQTTYIRDYPNKEEFIDEVSKLFYTIDAKNIIFKSSFIQNLKFSYVDYVDNSIPDKENIFDKEDLIILEKINFIKDYKLTDEGKQILDTFLFDTGLLELSMSQEIRLKEFILSSYLSKL